MALMTAQEIYSYRFCLGHAAPAGDLRNSLARQVEDDPPVLWNVYDDFYAPPPPKPYLSNWQTIRAAQKSRLAGEAYKEAIRRTCPQLEDFWNPLTEYCQSGDRPFVARLMLDQPNAAPTFEPVPIYTYSFWAQILFANMLKTHGDWLSGIILNHSLYVEYLNTNENIGPNSVHGTRGGNPPPDENLARELMEILSFGADFQSPADLQELSLLLSGLRTMGYDPQYAEPGDRTILGQTFGRGDIEGFLRWIAVHPKTAESQCRRLVEPILGRNYSPALREHLEQVWLDTGGDRRAVLTAMVLHDDAWNPQRGTPVNTLVGYVTHMVESGAPWPQGGNVRWSRHLGYDYEHAPSPEGLINDERLIGASQLLYRTQWPGSQEQRLVSMSHTRVIV